MSARPDGTGVLELYKAFQQRRRWRGGALAEHFGISREALRKRMYRMQPHMAGLTVERRDGELWFSMPEGWLPDGVGLDRADVELLLELLQYAPRQRRRDALVRKLLTRLPTQEQSSYAAERVHIGELAPEVSERLESLERALRAHTVVRVRYLKRDTPEQRVLSPLRLVPGPAFKLLAWCHKQQAFRFFLLERMLHIAPDAAHTYQAVAPAQIDAFLTERRVFGYVGTGLPVRCEFELYEPAARWSVSTLRTELPRSLALERTEKGALRASLEVPGDAVDKLAAYVVRHGELARALTEPLRSEVLRLAKASLEVHARAAEEGGT